MTKIITRKYFVALSNRFLKMIKKLVLKIASLVAFYEDAGQQPKLFEGEIIAQKQEENQPMASQKFLAILDEIVLLQTQFRNHLLDVWLDKLIEKQQVCSAKKTVMLLGLSENLRKKFHQKITKVLGKDHLWALKTDSMLEMERSVRDLGRRKISRT